MIVINLSVSTTDVIVDGKVRSTSFDWSMLGQGCKSKALTYNPYRCGNILHPNPQTPLMYAEI